MNNLGRQCALPDEVEVICSYQKITIRVTDSEGVVSDYEFFRHYTEISGDCEAGTVTLQHNVGFDRSPSNLDTNAYTIHSVPGQKTKECNKCDEVCTPSPEYEALLNKVMACWNSCCGSIPVGLEPQDFTDGAQDTPYAGTVASVSDECPLDNQLQTVSPTYSLIDDTSVNGSAIVNANGSFTFTPDSGFTGIASFQAGMHCDGNLVGIATITIQFA